LGKIEILAKDRRFGKKSKIWQKIEDLAKNRNFGKKKKRNFGKKCTFGKHRNLANK